jgi:hypothetical protein
MLARVLLVGEPGMFGRVGHRAAAERDHRDARPKLLDHLIQALELGVEAAVGSSGQLAYFDLQAGASQPFGHPTLEVGSASAHRCVVLYEQHGPRVGRKLAHHLTEMSKGVLCHLDAMQFQRRVLVGARPPAHGAEQARQVGGIELEARCAHGSSRQPRRSHSGGGSRWSIRVST